MDTWKYVSSLGTTRWRKPKPSRTHQTRCGTRASSSRLHKIYFRIIYSNYFFQIPSNEIVNQTLYMQLFDWDRMSKNDPLGEVKLNLGYFDLSNVKTEWRQLQKYSGKVGSIIL